MTEEKIVDRIRKLLRLAKDKGASEGEASSALAMASKLMLQYNIDHVDEKTDELKVIHGEWTKYGKAVTEQWFFFVHIGVGELYQCRSVRRKLSGEYRFTGQPENIAAAEVTMIFVCEQIEDLYKVHLRDATRVYGRTLTKSERGDLRRSFKEACGMRVSQRIKEIIAVQRNEIPSHMALVVIDQALAKADEMLKGIKTMTMKVRYGRGSGAGHAAGDQVKIQGAVGKSARRLTHG